MDTKKELIEAITANPVYKVRSGLRLMVARGLKKLDEVELDGLAKIIVAKGGIKLD